MAIPGVCGGIRLRYTHCTISSSTACAHGWELVFWDASNTWSSSRKLVDCSTEPARILRIEMATAQNSARHRDVLVSLRRIIRAIDLHSRSLKQRFGLTGPQLIILEALVELGECSITELSEAISLSLATVTGILSRLESRGLIERRRDDTDRRKVLVRVTPACDEVLSKAPTPLQESFISELDKLQDWEQALIISSLQRIVAMMEATTIDATPMLVTGAIDDSAEHTNGSGAHGQPSSAAPA